MSLSRRDFLKLTSGTAVVASAIGGAALSAGQAEANDKELRTQDAKTTTTICPFCSVGCGILAYTKDGRVIHTEGDPDHPVSEGTLCSKGASVVQVINNPARITKPRYRAPGASEWKEVEWDWTLDEIARRVKETREKTFKATSKIKVKEKAAGGQETEVEKEFAVNRTEGIAHVGSAALDNEECYMLQKLLRSWGLVYIEHQARI
jgi:formate dehydrogenase major subunit